MEFKFEETDFWNRISKIFEINDLNTKSDELAGFFISAILERSKVKLETVQCKVYISDGFVELYLSLSEEFMNDPVFEIMSRSAYLIDISKRISDFLKTKND